jgi:hypothetical protein
VSDAGAAVLGVPQVFGSADGAEASA